MDVRHPGADQHDDGQRVSRRRFISVAAAGTLVGTAGASLLLSACQPQAAPPAGSGSSGSSAPASSGAQSGSSAPPKASGADPFPKFAPVANAPKPDYQVDDPRFDVGFDNFPQNPFKSVTEAPGRGGDVNVL